MTTKRLLAAAATFTLLLLASCGGGDGVELGAFPAINKTEGDAPFDLTAPTSKSPAPFTFSSSDTKVATVAGNKVTVHLAGATTITAQQGSMGSYNPTSTGALLTVKERVCAAPSERDRTTGVCVGPATTASYVNGSDLTWMPATVAVNWSEADNFCKNTTIKSSTGWRLPTRSELRALADSGALNGQGWKLGDTWTATADTAAGAHFIVDTTAGATTGNASAFANDNKAYVTCVRGA